MSEANFYVKPAPTLNRHNFVLLFDVINGNPNGDPNNGNDPRTDDGYGIVTDVCIKRKIRNFWQNMCGQPIQIRHDAVLEDDYKVAYEKVMETRKVVDAGDGDKKNGKGKGKKKGADKDHTVEDAAAKMCEMFIDVRTFGAMMASKVYSCGTVRGPVQLSFARTLDRVSITQHAITRQAASREIDAENVGTIGRKPVVSYGLYQMNGNIDPTRARDTGFNEADMRLLWKAIVGMFPCDVSAGRSLNLRKLFVFEHSSYIGDAHNHEVFECVKVKSSVAKPTQFADYVIEPVVPPKGVKFTDIAWGDVMV